MKKNSLSIIGFGRFGKVLYRLFKSDFKITLYDADRSAFTGINLAPGDRFSFNLKDIYSSETIFYAVPIEAFEKTIASHRKYFQGQLLIDVLSVKRHPAEVFKKYLKGTGSRAILTHPMFGPDSSKNGFKGLAIAINRFTAAAKEYRFWKNYFQRKGLKAVEMKPEEHDKMAADSQGVTHFVGRLLQAFKLKPTKIDTLGAKKLYEVMEQTCHDSWQLFSNLQNYNPYTKRMRLRLGVAYDKVYQQLLPGRVSKNYLIYGIQGGVGSFNEEAILSYLKRRGIGKYKIKYLYTSPKVLADLHKGNIDFGLFAIHNSVGGIVEESIKALAKHKIKIVEEFAIPIRHFLMKKRGVDFKEIKAIMAHPQVFRQCVSTLKEKYPSFPQLSGKGDLIDTAQAARALAQGKLPINTAILGPRRLAELYDFEIVEGDLEDDRINNTSFLLVKR